MSENIYPRLEKDLRSVIKSGHRVINCVIRCDVWQG